MNWFKLSSETSMLFNLDFANDTILSYFFLFLITVYLWLFLVPTVITQIFNPVAELLITVEIPIKEGKAENNRHSVTVQIKISNYSI